VRRIPFSCYARSDSFSVVPRASDPVFIVSAPRQLVGGTEGARSRFYVLRSRTRFRRCQVRRVPFSSFARPDLFSAVPRSSIPVFMFCAPGLFFDGTEGVRSRFHILCTNNHAIKTRIVHRILSCLERGGINRRRIARLGVMHVGTMKKIHDVFGLSEEETIRGWRYFNAKKIVKSYEICDGKLRLK
jgi:hypothetical protein